MNVFFWTAIVLMAGLALVHSVLGERYILIRLFRRTDLPKLFGSSVRRSSVIRLALPLSCEANMKQPSAARHSLAASSASTVVRRPALRESLTLRAIGCPRCYGRRSASTAAAIMFRNSLLAVDLSGPVATGQALLIATTSRRDGST